MTETWGASRAVVAGVAGTSAVAGAMALARRAGYTRLEFPRILASAVGPPDRRSARAAGWALFVGAGALLPAGYRAALRSLGEPASVPLGAALGFGHGLVAAAGAALMTPLHPRPRRARLASASRPRPPVRELAIVVAVHVLYGIVLGAAARGRA